MYQQWQRNGENISGIRCNGGISEYLSIMKEYCGGHVLTRAAAVCGGGRRCDKSRSNRRCTGGRAGNRGAVWLGRGAVAAGTLVCWPTIHAFTAASGDGSMARYRDEHRFLGGGASAPLRCILLRNLEGRCCCLSCAKQTLRQEDDGAAAHRRRTRRASG